MREYKYYAILNDGDHRIVWNGKAKSINEFLGSIPNSLFNFGYEVAECHREPPKTRREKPYISMALVDMGQCSRF